MALFPKDLEENMEGDLLIVEAFDDDAEEEKGALGKQISSRQPGLVVLAVQRISQVELL